jgi:hypothetical protein
MTIRRFLRPGEEGSPGLKSSVAEPLTAVRYQKIFGTLTADIEIPAIELLIAGTLDSLTIPALTVNDGRIAVRRYIAHEELERAASRMTILSG